MDGRSRTGTVRQICLCDRFTVLSTKQCYLATTDRRVVVIQNIIVEVQQQALIASCIMTSFLFVVALHSIYIVYYVRGST